MRAGDDVELLPLPGAGHFELVDPLAPEWAVIRAKAARTAPMRSS